MTGLIAAAAVLAVALPLAAAGVVPFAIINVSPSMPMGLYVRTSVNSLRAGDIVAVCLRDRAHRKFVAMALSRGYIWNDRLGSCAVGAWRFAPLVKRIVAVSGDTVQIGRSGIFVNGRREQQSRPLRVDSKGRALPQVRLSVRVPRGEYVIEGENPRSYDSRYFGLVPREDILERLKLL